MGGRLLIGRDLRIFSRFVNGVLKVLGFWTLAKTRSRGTPACRPPCLGQELRLQPRSVELSPRAGVPPEAFGGDLEKADRVRPAVLIDRLELLRTGKRGPSLAHSCGEEGRRGFEILTDLQDGFMIPTQEKVRHAKNLHSGQTRI